MGAPKAPRTAPEARFGSVTIPYRVVDPADTGTFVAEAQPIPTVGLYLSAGPTLEPRKLAAICSFTRELAEHSSIEAVVRQSLSEAAALALDVALFSDSADDGASPSGLLYPPSLHIDPFLVFVVFGITGKCRTPPARGKRRNPRINPMQSNTLRPAGADGRALRREPIEIF